MGRDENDKVWGCLKLERKKNKNTNKVHTQSHVDITFYGNHKCL